MKSKDVDNLVKFKEPLTVQNKLYDLTISINDVQRNVIFKRDDKLWSVFNLDGTYTKVKVSIKNNASKDAEINGFIFPFDLLDSSKNKIGRCEYGILIRDDKLKDEKLRDIIPANSEICGYIYCKTESKEGAILCVSVPSNISVNDSGGYLVSGDEFYFELK